MWGRAEAIDIPSEMRADLGSWTPRPGKDGDVTYIITAWCRGLTGRRVYSAPFSPPSKTVAETDAFPHPGRKPTWVETT